MHKEIIELIDRYWKFDNDQQHLSSWHDKQDLISAIIKMESDNIAKQKEIIQTFREWYDNLSVEELIWYEGRYEDIFLNL